jgi:hypothetical protein
MVKTFIILINVTEIELFLTTSFYYNFILLYYIPPKKFEHLKILKCVHLYIPIHFDTN